MKKIAILALIIIVFLVFMALGYFIDPSFVITNKEKATNNDIPKNTDQEKEEEEEKCQKLWWYDKDNKVCKEKEFCGAYMYFGLKTFEKKDECDKSLKEYLSFPTQTKEEKDKLIEKIGPGEYSADELIEIIGSN